MSEIVEKTVRAACDKKSREVCGLYRLTDVPTCKYPDCDCVYGEIPGPEQVISAFLDALAEPSEAMVDAALASTNVRLDIPGSQLTVDREKMRVRYRAMIAALRTEIGDV